jgi:hypothetical protein
MNRNASLYISYENFRFRKDDRIKNQIFFALEQIHTSFNPARNGARSRWGRGPSEMHVVSG